MSKIILDFGSGNTCKNNWDYTKRMIDELKEVDTGKHEVVIKWQLFKEAGENIPLHKSIFDLAYNYAMQLGYKTTASIFDKESLDFLLQFDPCFVKIANNRKLDWLIGEIPRKIPVYVSYGVKGDNQEEDMFREDTPKYNENIIPFLCVSKYPTTIEDYEKDFGELLFRKGLNISDHTTNFGLWYRYRPEIVEWHYVLEYDTNNLDGGLFAKTPTMLKEVL